MSHIFGRTCIYWFQLDKIGLFRSATPYSLHVKHTRITLVLICRATIRLRGFHVLQIKKRAKLIIHFIYVSNE
jgi:hypothetical protein